MIDLQTGLPGAGKTLYSIWRIKQKSEAEGRPVYYSGISDLKLPWIELEDPTKWYECPANSIIVIDECQRVFRPRGNGSAVPEHVAKLETHRHLGIDLVFITQHPMLVDSNVRRLVGKHYHSVRAFGQQKARVFEFESVKENPVAARSTGIEHNFKYPKEIFDYYKSAEVHTHKTKRPLRYYALFALPPLAIALIGFTVSWFYDRTQGVPIGGTQPTAQHAGTGAPSTSSAGRTREGKLTTAQYLQDQQPRIQGLAYTAPVYDEVTRPTQAPYPAACLTLRNECRCYSQQGTRLAVEQTLCDKIVQDGFFLAWDARTPEQRERRHEANRNAPLLASASTATPTDLVIGAPAPREGLSTAPSSTTPQTTSQPTQQPYQPRVPANSPWRAP
ncbi:zonular occludens toxin domain-containing protein [Methyloversatilis sp. XJ19-49]|uniref:zonular occludens toxin domain-containing protein n=1 Tax=Methyloversatilis sp. XJ19-49 TaxID=2963429 RepID=UPI00211C844A|nr:zonular occludens toxin domain-containing protein [Methyloversatilis sp. XJ19-49]MCQ9378321.1 zonular occludens toxin domain-containing protein [Methyloversatilis sp. XJ19-49]